MQLPSNKVSCAVGEHLADNHSIDPLRKVAVMTDTASTTSSSTPTAPSWTRWLYPILGITGIAVGIFIIGAGLYLIFAQPSDCHHMMKADAPLTATQSKDCCASMMKDMKMPMENKPSMSPMPGMPSMPNMPTPTPSR
jgi:hypothetical protein